MLEPLSSATLPEADPLVALNPDHPGFRDPIYRARRNAIAKLALDHREGAPAPYVAYTDVEHDVWRSVWEHLEPLHAARAVRAWRAAAARGCARCARGEPPRRASISTAPACRSSPSSTSAPGRSASRCCRSPA
jgi:hypothetical protein